MAESKPTTEPVQSDPRPALGPEASTSGVRALIADLSETATHIRVADTSGYLVSTTTLLVIVQTLDALVRERDLLVDIVYGRDQDAMGRASEEIRDVLSAFAKSEGAQPTDQRHEGWQPIDSAPKDGSTVVLFAPCRHSGHVIDTAHWCDNSNTPHPWCGWSWHCLTAKAGSGKPTHWQPLPSPPVEAQKAGGAR